MWLSVDATKNIIFLKRTFECSYVQLVVSGGSVVEAWTLNAQNVMKRSNHIDVLETNKWIFASRCLIILFFLALLVFSTTDMSFSRKMPGSNVTRRMEKVLSHVPCQSHTDMYVRHSRSRLANNKITENMKKVLPEDAIKWRDNAVTHTHGHQVRELMCQPNKAQTDDGEKGQSKMPNDSFLTAFIVIFLLTIGDIILFSIKINRMHHWAHWWASTISHLHRDGRRKSNEIKSLS